MQQQAGHEHASTTAIYTNSQELHQTGEKLQVAWLSRGRDSSRAVTKDAVWPA
jgi:hypothetical protein